MIVRIDNIKLGKPYSMFDLSCILIRCAYADDFTTASLIPIKWATCLSSLHAHEIIDIDLKLLYAMFVLNI